MFSNSMKFNSFILLVFLAFFCFETVQSGDVLEESIYFDDKNQDLNKFFAEIQNFSLEKNRLVFHPNGGNTTGVLRTKSLKNAKNYFTFGVDLKNEEAAKIFLLSVTLFNVNGVLITHSDVEYGEIFNFTIDPLDNIDVYTAHIEIKNRRDFKIEEIGANNVVLSNFFINNPCVGSKPSESFACVPGHFEDFMINYAEQTCSCKCKKGYYGDKCQNINFDINYCEHEEGGISFKSKYCNGADCKNRNDLQAAECICNEEETKFNFLTKQCIKIPRNCSSDSQQLEMKNGHFMCDCPRGFISLDQKNCVKYDGCSSEHRSARGKSPVVCPVNSKCVAQDDEDKDYSCECDNGFLNWNGTYTVGTKCVSVKCTTDIYGCQQGCVPTGDKCRCHSGYSNGNQDDCLPDKNTQSTVDRIKCVSSSHPQPYLHGETCVCRDGFKWDGAARECQLNAEDPANPLAQALGCRHGVEIKWQDGGIGCACEEDEMFDFVSRNCVPLKKTREECRLEHNAFLEPNSGECQCENDEIADSTKPNSWRCINKCEFLDSSATLKPNRCDKTKEFCASNSLFIDPSTHQIQNGTNRSYCQCRDGFENKDGGCHPITIPERLLRIEMKFHLETDREQYPKETAKKSFTELLKNVIKGSDAPRNVVCNFFAKNEMFCATTVMSSFGPTPTEENLSKLKSMFKIYSQDIGSELGFIIKVDEYFALLRTKLDNIRIEFAN